MKIKEIRGKNMADLRKALGDKREALRNFRFGISGSKTKNIREGRGLRRDIAKIITVLNEKKSN